MKKICVRLLITLLAVCSLSSKIYTLSAAGDYIPSWQTVKASLPHAAYWPGIGAVGAATLALNPFDVRGRLLGAENLQQESLKRKIATLITLPYALPYSLPQYLRLKKQFLAEHRYPEQALELPFVQAAWLAYVDMHLKQETASRTAYWLGMPAALLLGGYLYNAYRK